MMKFFRKNLKGLLAFFMALLLLVWLGGEALTSYFSNKGEGQRLNSPRGQAFGKTVKFSDMLGAFNELEVLNSLGVNWRRLWAYPVLNMGVPQYYQYTFISQVRDPQKLPLTEDEWYMLDAEARRRQVFVPQETVDRFKEQMGIDPRSVAFLQKKQISTGDVDRAIQSFVRVLRLVGQASEGVKISEADLQNYVRQTREKVQVNVVVVDAAKLTDDKYQPTEQEMKNLFEKNKDRDPAPGSMNEFGYRRPEMTQIEYIQVSEAELAKLQQVREEEAFDYWSEHKSEFLKPSTQPASAPTTQPRPEDRQPYATFTEAKALVIEKLRTDRAKAEALRLARELVGRLLSRSWAGAAATQPGCKEPPVTEKSDQVYTAMINTVGKRYPGVLKYARTTLTDETGIGMNPEIGRASAFAETKRPVPFRAAAFELCGLKSDQQANPDLARLHRNVYETCAEPVVDTAGNAYVFRNVAASPKQAPPSWESVREQLVQDVRKMRAYAEAERQAKALAEQAAKTGLQKAYDADTALKAKLAEAGYKSPEAFARKMGWQMEMFPNRIPGVGGDEKLINTCFELAGKKTQSDRVKAAPLAGRGWIVVEGLETVPVNQTEYEEQRNQASAILGAQRQVEFLHNWFDPEQIKQRVGWKDAEPEKKKGKQEGEQADTATKPASEQKKS